MSPKCIKINKVYKTKPLKVFLCFFYSLLHTLNRAVRLICLCDTLCDKDIVYLTYGNHIKAGIFKRIKSSINRRFNCVIMAVRSSFKLTLLLAYIRSCNNSSNLPFILHTQLSGYFTASIKIGKVKGLLVSTYLKHRVSRGVDYHLSFFYFSFRKLFKDLSS